LFSGIFGPTLDVRSSSFSILQIANSLSCRDVDLWWHRRSGPRIQLVLLGCTPLCHAAASGGNINTRLLAMVEIHNHLWRLSILNSLVLVEQKSRKYDVACYAPEWTSLSGDPTLSTVPFVKTRTVLDWRLSEVNDNSDMDPIWVSAVLWRTLSLPYPRVRRLLT